MPNTPLREQNSIRQIPLARPEFTGDELNELRIVLESGWVSQGPKVKEFEDLFSVYHGVQHSIAVSNCTTALHLALLAADVRPGDEVVVPSFTWVATANAVAHCGAIPVFADVQKETFNICPESLSQKISLKTKAVMPVHLFGLCADMDAVKAAVPDKTIIVEDAACAMGAQYKGRRSGTIGDMACFSFHARKNITTGEGGMLTTNNDSYADAIISLRSHGASASAEIRHAGPQPYLLPDFDRLGYNYRLSDIQAAVGISQMKKFETYLARRQEMARIYHELLGDIPWLVLPSCQDSDVHAWQSFVTTVNPDMAPMPRNEIMAYLHENGIATRPGTHASHALGYFKTSFGTKDEDCPNALFCDQNSMAIPFYNSMDTDDFAYIADKLHALNN